MRIRILSIVAVVAIVGAAFVFAARTPTAVPTVDPNNAVWVLEISGLSFGQPMKVHLATAQGRIVRGLAVGPGKCVHTVDTAGLSVTPGRLHGMLKVTANPDPWFPKDGKPVASQVEIDAIVRDGRIGGTYKGKRGSDDAAGMLVGTLRAVSAPEGTWRIDLEQALEGPVVEQRVGLSLSVEKGKVSHFEATARDARQWKGDIKAHSISITAEKITGEITLQVSDPLDVTGGTYTFTLDGVVVGSTVAGHFRSKLGDREVCAKAAFTGTLQ